MKKYIVTLAAMALAVGGTINLTGCGGVADDPDATKNEGEQESVPEGGESTGGVNLDEEAKKRGFIKGDAGTETGGTKEAPAPEKKD